MTHRFVTWLIYNRASGSNDDAALSRVRDLLPAAGFDLCAQTCFPQEELPDLAELSGQGVDCVAVFAGDGTINATISALAGWDGAILVLPGGTMNLLSRRLHGDALADEILSNLRNVDPRKVRPGVIRNRHGVGLAGVIVGPGATWNEAREAMRDVNIAGVAAGAIDAIRESIAGAKVTCQSPECGRDEGYQAIVLTPLDGAIEGNGYFAETLDEFAQQGLAILHRDFRQGPHEMLGQGAGFELASSDGNPMNILIDGETVDAGAQEQFTFARCEVDLLATDYDG